MFRNSVPAFCILELQRHINAEKEQYEITHVVSPDWIKWDEIYSDQFLDDVPNSTSKTETP